MVFYSKSMDRVLLVRTDRVGDLVLATPCIQAVKEAWPSCEVTFLASGYGAPVLENNSYLDRLLVYWGESAGELAETLKRYAFDAVVCLFPTFTLSVAFFKAGIPVRVASGFRWYQWLYNKRTYLRRSQALKKEWEYNLDLLRLLGWQGEYLRPRVYLSPQEEEWARDVARKEGWPEEFVALYPGGGREMRWPLHHFTVLAELLRERGLAVVVFWGPGEEDLAGALRKAGAFVAPPTNLRQLMALISLAKAMVANNTGPMHIGAALGLPLVQLFDPRRACNPARWGYYGTGKRVLLPPVPRCGKCTTKCEYYPCMEGIEPQEVLEALEEVLSGKG